MKWQDQLAKDCPPEDYAALQRQIKMTNKPSAPRVASYRKRLADLGLKQRSVYVHDEDWPMVHRLISDLHSKRKNPESEDTPLR